MLRIILGLLAGSLRNMGESRHDLDIQDTLRTLAVDHCPALASCTCGEVSQVAGLVWWLAVPPAGQNPRTEIALRDGTGTLRVVWIGRRQMPGITAGTHLVVTGRLTRDSSGLVMYNPRYEIRPNHASV